MKRKHRRIGLSMVALLVIGLFVYYHPVVHKELTMANPVAQTKTISNESYKQDENSMELASEEMFQTTQENNRDTNVFDAESIKAFDGKNGAKTYIAVDGVVYDVSEIPYWKNGQHHGVFAGRDVSLEFKFSPHTNDILNQAKVVGTYKN